MYSYGLFIDLMICIKKKWYQNQFSAYASAFLGLHVYSSYNLRSLVVQRDITYTLNPLTNISHKLVRNIHYNPFVDEE